MNSRTIDIIYAVSLIIVGIVSIISGVSGILGADMPDALRRVLGAAALIALAALAFSGVTKLKNRKKK